MYFPNCDKMFAAISSIYKKINSIYTINPFFSCGYDIETTSHFLLHCSLYSDSRSTFLNNIKNITGDLVAKSDINLTNLLLYGDMFLSTENNTSILNFTIEFLLKRRRFEEPRFYQ